MVHHSDALLAVGGVMPSSSWHDAPSYAMFIPLLPMLSAVVCGLLPALGRDSAGRGRRLPAWICVGGLGGAFLVSAAVIAAVGDHPARVDFAEWIHAGRFRADLAMYIDPLTSVMLLVVTGIGTLVALYASEYMAGNRGYARFFAFVSLFIVAMTCLVLADNLLLLYLGWEGVGLCSYLLIGFDYRRPAAVAAAKKAFIVNRIGDLGFALGLMLTYREFGTIEYGPLFDAIARGPASSGSAAVTAIPFLLMIGAFGKSAQLPLHVWLPDAMEGPTPVSALIHAATMVTAGVYMVARLFPLFLLSPAALPTVAWVGGLTAMFAATIAMGQHDIKRIFAYSTVSQLGYMFVGLGVMSSTGAVFHLFTHAFFKALLFLASGAVMHGFAGQLDLRKLSGLRRESGWGVVTWTMLAGCLALAGFVGTSGFFSKDLILASAMSSEDAGLRVLGWMGLLTAGLTAYYTFRVFFRVFLGPTHYEPVGDHGSHDPTHGSGTGGSAESGHEHFHPHAPGLAINFVLIVLAVGALLVGYVGVGGEEGSHGWIGRMMAASTAGVGASGQGGGTAAGAHGAGFWDDPHRWMMPASSLVALIGIAVAAYFHWINRPAAERAKARLGIVAVLAENKWYVDEGYERLIRRPLRMAGQVCYTVGDSLIVNGLVGLAGAAPRWLGRAVRPSPTGVLNSYATGMAGGLAVLAFFILWQVMAT